MGFITHCSNSGCVSTWIDPRHLRIPWCSFFFLSFFLTLFLLYYACSNPAFVCVNACYPIQTGFRTSYEFWGEIQRKCSIAGSTTTTKKKRGRSPALIGPPRWTRNFRQHNEEFHGYALHTAHWGRDPFKFVPQGPVFTRRHAVILLELVEKKKNRYLNSKSSLIVLTFRNSCSSVFSRRAQIGNWKSQMTVRSI